MNVCFWRLTPADSLSCLELWNDPKSSAEVFYGGIGPGELCVPLRKHNRTVKPIALQPVSKPPDFPVGR